MSQGSPRLLLALLNIKLFYLYEVSGVKWIPHFLEKLGFGESIEQIIEEHPRLTEENIRAALAFASDALRADVVYPITRQKSEVPC